jgi:magnesium transporter
MEKDPRHVIEEVIPRLIEEDRWAQITSVLVNLHPADVAELIRRRDDADRFRIFSLIDDDDKPAVLAELEGNEAGEDLIQALSLAELSRIVEEMPPDDAADVLAEMPEEQSNRILALMEEEESEDVRKLLEYDEETAGGIMTTDVVSFPEIFPVREVLERIPELEPDRPCSVLYSVDKLNRLTGYISLWELLKVRDRKRPLSEFVHRELQSVPTGLDQEEVAHRMERYDLNSIPVVDEKKRLVGRITIDDIVDVMREEASEDIFRMAGSDDKELAFASPTRAVRHRLPWLLITLATGFVTSLLLKAFMSDLSSVLVLTSFVPIVMAMGGNTGIQSSTLVIRSLALDVIDMHRVWKLLLREVATGALMGLLCGAGIGIWAHIVITGNAGADASIPPLYLAGTVAISLFSAMTFAALYGAFVPLVLDRLGVDPAVSSGPFVTSSNDISALVIYYGIAIAMIGLHPGVTGLAG